MRFRGTLILLIICLGLAGYVYFYEIKGGAQREKAKQGENQVWKFDVGNIEQLSLTSQGQTISARRKDKDWEITAPRLLDADTEEFKRLASSAAEITKESVVQTHAPDLATYGLSPPQTTLQFKTKEGQEKQIRFGNNNPTGSSTYAALAGSDDVFLVQNYVATAFKKKLDDLRNHSILRFEQFDTQSMDLQSAKGKVQLVKENEKWWIQGKEKWGADSSAVNDMLSALSTGKIKEFVDENSEQYAATGFVKPTVDVRLVVGKDRAIKHLIIGAEKSDLVKQNEKGAGRGQKAESKNEKSTPGTSGLYLAKDETRPDLFFVDKDLVDKLLKSPSDLRDKALASFQRWDIDSITLTNSKGTIEFTKSGGDWVLGSAKKKTKWDAVNGILDALEKPVKEFIETPAALSAYGLDRPTARVVLKQGGTTKVDCSLGKEGKAGVYALVQGESAVKVADKESLEKLDKGEADFVETPAPTPTTAAPTAKK